MKIRNNKGQTEFFGLVVIVFLLSLGLIFLISLKGQENTRSIKTTYLEQAQSQNMINAMLNMRTDCKQGLSTGIKLSQLITDCADTKQIRCKFGMNSCEYVNKTIDKLFNLTFDEWNRPYYFFIEPVKQTGIMFQSLGCNDEVLAETPGKQPFPTRSGNGLIYLRLCSVIINS